MRKIQKLKVDLSQIPCPFNMREHAERVETGPIQFNDDWPGAFIRGDNAAYYAIHLQQALDQMEKGEEVHWLTISTLKNLLYILRGSHITNIVEDDDTSVGC